MYLLLFYKLHEEGYELYILEGNSTKLSLPSNFWDGLGICKTNVIGFTQERSSEINT